MGSWDWMYWICFVYELGDTGLTISKWAGGVSPNSAHGATGEVNLVTAKHVVIKERWSTKRSEWGNTSRFVLSVGDKWWSVDNVSINFCGNKSSLQMGIVNLRN